MRRNFIIGILAIGLCFSFISFTQAATIVSINATATLEDVAALQVSITSDNASGSDWIPNWPDAWINFSGGKTVNGFDSLGGNSLETGEVGRFEADGVLLDDWVLGDQNADPLVLGTDYFVKVVEGGYELNPVPIPSAILLLGGGLVSLFAVRRRRK